MHDSLEQRISKIEARNARVEVDKAWEKSVTRRFVILFCTYLAIGFYLELIKAPEPWLNAIVPAVGFSFSTLTLPFVKKIWARYCLRGVLNHHK